MLSEGMFILWIVYISCFVLTKTGHAVKNDWPTYEVNGKICYYCSAGFYWVDDCQTTGTQAQCMPCPSGTYQKDKNIAQYCGTCTKCDSVVRNYDLAVELVRCSGQSDTICGCKETYHFRLNHGGMGVGICHKNSMCPVGSGVLKNGSYFSDTTCIECESGFTFSSTESYEACLQCTTVCQNSTFVKQPCNATHDMECQTKKDHIESTKNKIPRSSSSSSDLAIGLGTTLSIIVLLVVVSVQCIIRRTRNDNTEVKKQMSQRIPHWITKCNSGTTIQWNRIFAICPGYILPDWEAFIRILYVYSHDGKNGQHVDDDSENGQHTVEMAKEAFEKELIKSRIDYALRLWKQKYVTCENESEMFDVFCKAVDKHKRKWWNTCCCCMSQN